MYLKRLEIQGFKSFADKTKVEFNDGITSVVGPNGSGKSNISDSIRWVLGEQSAKSLRGGKMEDVIFAGTEHRKALGFAEVSLTIDNDSKVLPLDFSEVTVTRRVYRSGEGEYFINKSPCRLKDIHELFMDTGIGKDGYSIIGQGRVDEILSSRSEDRRAIFEEASGIMKYKTRKQESEKKLEQTENNLIRINDIVNELEVQLEPLEKQAEVARKYLDLREQLKELEVSVFIENIAKAKEKILEAEDNIKVVEQNIEKENLKLAAKTEESREDTSKLKELEEELEYITKEYYEYETSLERANSEIKINKEKIIACNNNINRLNQELNLLQNKNGEISLEMKEKEDKLKEYSNKLDKDSAILLDVTAKYDALVANLGEGEKKLEELNKSLVTKLGEQTELKLSLAQSKNVLDNLNERNYNIKTEITQVELQKSDIIHQKKEVEKALEVILGEIEFHKEQINKLNIENIDLKQKHLQFEKRLNALKNDIHLKNSRKKMLQSMEANLEGYYRSVRELLKECDRNPSFAMGIHGALAKLIEVSTKHAIAIEMTMAGALQNVVTSTEEDAKRAIEYLKKNRLGRATFLPISAVKGKRLDERTLGEASKMPGFVGLACDSIKYSPKYEGIILNLLGKVVVAEDLDTGIAIARKFGYSFRIVTLDGDVLSTSGSMAGGSNDNKEGGILNRSAEILDISKEIDKLIGEETIVSNNLNDIIIMQKEVESELLEIEKTLRDSEHARIREDSHLAQVSSELEKIEARLLSLKSENDNFAQVLTSASSKHLGTQGEIDKREMEIEEVKEFISSHQGKHKEEQLDREKILLEITDLKVNIGALKETTENYRQMLQRFLSETNSINESIRVKTEEIRNNSVEIEQISKINTVSLEKIGETEFKKKEKAIVIENKGKNKKELDEQTHKIVVLLQEINNNLLLLNEEQGRLNVKRARLDSELESIQNRLWDEYELTYNNALSLKKEIENMVQAQRQINEYRSEMKNLGPVNVASIEEFIKTKERFDFLKTQKEDLDNAKEKLHLIIADLTEVMKKQFIEQFKLINENFNMVFKELFGGGRADLILSDKENVLESGIEIEVQPPGKKLQNMMLLSGGERAFTAIALLFSILKLRPAPFCLLDEIEAALDDANVYKFAQYIKRHTHLTQFLVITHRKGTMESSDSLYGITMQEQGVSNIISLKLGDKFVNLN